MNLDKRANIPIIILVVLTIALVVVALLAFHLEREAEEADINAFKYLRVMYNFENDLEFSGINDIEKLKQELYPKSWIVIDDKKPYRGYYPAAELIEKQNNYLVIEKNNFELKIPA